MLPLMKSVNFINPVPPQKQKELGLWFYGSVATLTALIFGLSGLYYHSKKHCCALAYEVKQLQEITQHAKQLASKREKLVVIKEALDRQLHAVSAQRNHAQTPHQILTTIARIIPASCRLTKLEAHPSGEIHIHGESNHAKACAAFLDLLSSCPQINDARLASLSPSKHLTSFIIIGSWKTTEHDTEPWAELHD